MASSDRSRMRSRGGTSVRRKSNSSYSFVITCCGERERSHLDTWTRLPLSVDLGTGQREGETPTVLLCVRCQGGAEGPGEPGHCSQEFCTPAAALGGEQDTTCPLLGLK